MKGFQKLIIIFSLLLSLKAFAQPDLSISSFGPYSFPGDGQTHLVDVFISNNGNNATVSGITVNFAIDGQAMPLQFEGTAFGGLNWDCSQITSANPSCTTLDNLNQGADDTLQVGVIVQPGDFDFAPAFFMDVVDINGDEVFTNDNFNTVDIEFTTGSLTDFQVQLLNPNPPIQFPAGSGSQIMSFEITNLGPNDEGDQTTVTFDINSQLDPQLINPASASSNDPNWSCITTTLQVICDYFNIFTTGQSSTIDLTVPIPDQAPMPATITNAVGVSMFNALGDPDPSNNTDQFDIEITSGGSPEIEITKSVVGSLTEVIQGDNLEYLIEVNNIGVGDASNVVFTDILPVGVTYQSHTGLGPNFTCNFNAGTLTCTAPNLPVTASQDGVRINVTADGALGQVQNTASTTFVDGNALNNSSTASFNIIAPTADLDITIVSDLANYSVGDFVTHNLTLHNPSNSNAAPTNTVLSVTLSPETVFESAVETTTVGFSCTHDGSGVGGVVTCDSQGNAVPVNTNTLFEIVALANSPTPNTTSQADVSITSEFDTNPLNDTSSTLFFINNAVENLSLVFTSASDTYLQGDTITYTVQVENPFIVPRQAEQKAKEEVRSQDTVVTFTLPNEVVFDNADVSGATDWDCAHDNAPNGGIVTCDKGGLSFDPGAFDTISVNAIASQVTTNAFIQAEISSVADNDTSNNTDSYSDVINGVTSDFSITKTVNGTDFVIGDSFTYVLTIDNPIASTASPTDVVINDQLPVDVSFDNFIVGTNLGTTINCTHDGSALGGLFSCDTNGTPFSPGETVTVDINVTAENANNNVNNSATVETLSDPDGTANNNNDNSATVVINGPLTTTLVATKTATIAGVDISTVNLGQNFTYVLLVENTGVNDALNVHVSDFLPPEVTLIGVQSAGWTCSNANTKGDGFADVDCILNSPLAPGNTAQILIDVTATNDASVTSITNLMETVGDNTGTLVTADVVLFVGNPLASLVISQTPTPVDPGLDAEFGLQVNNSGNSDLTGIALNSQIPTGFIYNGFNGSAGWACNLNAGTVSCNYTGTLASNGNLILNLEMTSPVPQPNQSYVLDTTLSANELANDLTENLTVAFSVSDYSLSAQSSPLAVNPGQSFSHIIEVDNTGTFDLVNASLVYVSSNFDSIASVSSTDFTCSSTGNSYTCNNLQPIVVGQTSQITVNMNASNGLNGVSGNIAAQIDGVNRTAQVFTNIVNNFENDLSLTKTATVTEVGQNSSFAYQLTVNNLGTASQSNFSILDTLPEGVIFQNASGFNWTCVGNSELNCQFGGSLTTNQSSQLVLNVIAPNQIGQITNTATLIANNDENPTNNNSSATVNVIEGNGGGSGIADLSVNVEVSSDELINTEQVMWQFEIENLGPNSAQNVTLSNQLPMGFIAGTVQVSDGATCMLLTASLQCEIPTLAFNETIQIMLEGSIANDFTGVLMNTVEVESDTTDPNPSNNIAMRDVNVTAVEDLKADLSLEMNANSQNVQQGDTFDLSFIANNLGPDKSINPVIEGSLTGLINSVQFLNTSGWACQISGNNFTCMMPGDFIVGMSSDFDIRIITQQVVQQSQPIMFNAMITSDSMDTQPANNMIGFTNEVSRTPTEDEIFALFQNAVGSGASETVIQSIRNVSSYCARSYFMAIEGLCDEFIEDATPENGAAIINAMEEITPNEVAAQSNSAAEIIASQFRNVDSRLAQLRGGAGSGFSVAGLNARYGNESIPLGMLAYLNQSEEEQQAVSNINDFVSPWGFFVNGSISMGERDATGRELGFDFDTFGLTAGVDYRFSPTKVAGIALGYANFDSEIQDEAEMQSTGFTLTGYGSFYIKDNFYVDARISYGTPDFEQKRRINFTVDDIDIDRVAVGKTDADQYSVAMSAGYHFNKNSWVITPNASLRYVRTTIDAFQESGAGGFNFAFGEQEVKSMVWSLGASVSKAISLKNGIISPQFDFNLSRETENDGGLLETRFINAPDDEIFWIGTDEPDRTFGSAGVGLVFIGANGKQAYINYRSIFGLDGFSRGTINLGARFEF